MLFGWLCLRLSQVCENSFLSKMLFLTFAIYMTLLALIKRSCSGCFYCFKVQIVLLFEFEMFIRLDYVLQRCSISADSHIENSENDDPTDVESVDVKEKGYHDGGNEADHERDNDQTDDDQEWTLGGKMSESNGYAGSKLYGYKVSFLFPCSYKLYCEHE